MQCMCSACAVAMLLLRLLVSSDAMQSAVAWLSPITHPLITSAMPGAAECAALLPSRHPCCARRLILLDPSPSPNPNPNLHWALPCQAVACSA